MPLTIQNCWLTVGQGSSERVLYNRFLKELEDSGFVQEFYGKR
jgi:hypothetical protein